MDHNAFHVTDYDTSDESWSTGDDATAGTVIVTTAPIGGGTLVGTFSVTSTTTLTGDTAGINSMSGCFRIVRDTDD